VTCPGGSPPRAHLPASIPSAGAIAYYVPWGNLAAFYRDFDYSRGLVQIGSIDSGIEVLSRPGSLRVTIERIEEESL